MWFTEERGGKVAKVTMLGVITEYNVPTPGSSPTEITAGPDGNLWFTEGSGNEGGSPLMAGKVAKATTSGVVTEYSFPRALGCPLCLDFGPEGIVAGPDGNIWVTEASGDRVARVTTSGTITEFRTPSIGPILPWSITVGPDRNLWFTDYCGIVSKSTTAGAITEYSVAGAYSKLGGITTGPDGRLWFTEGSPNKVAAIVPPA
jgi:virginiamycin B lyase